MSLKTRRILYIFFILAFLILTPLLIFYSLGYNFRSGFKIEKSGILVINTEPRGAKISIEGKTPQSFLGKILNQKKFRQTPSKIKNIKPGDYNIKAELPGYWPWSKKLTIQSGKTTFAEDIYLFKKDKPIEVKEITEKSTTFSPNKKYFLEASSSFAKLTNLDTQETKTVHLDNQVNKKIELNNLWSPDNKKILNNFNIFNISNWDKPIYIKNIIGKNFDKFAWGNNNDVIFYNNNNKIFSFNLKNNGNKEILKNANLDDFFIKNNRLYLIEKKETDNIFSVFNIETKEKKTILKLPYSKYKFINKNHHLINLLDKNYNILYLIDPNSNIKTLKDTLYNVQKTKWINNSKLLYTTGFEIWVYNLNFSNQTLLTRLSEHIKNLEWHPSNNYILFSTKNGINILELDNREKHSITKIANFNNIDKMLLDKRGETVYFTTKEKNTGKLYKFFIQ